MCDLFFTIFSPTMTAYRFRVVPSEYWSEGMKRKTDTKAGADPGILARGGGVNFFFRGMGHFYKLTINFLFFNMTVELLQDVQKCMSLFYKMFKYSNPSFWRVHMHLIICLGPMLWSRFYKNFKCSNPSFRRVHMHLIIC